MNRHVVVFHIWINGSGFPTMKLWLYNTSLSYSISEGVRRRAHRYNKQKMQRQPPWHLWI